MTMLVFFGCLFIVFGPPLAAFSAIVKDGQMIILMISGAFFWLVSVFLASILWYIVKPLQDEYVWIIFISVLLQELFRFLFYKLFRKAEKNLPLSDGATISQLTRHKVAFVVGLGFGIMCGMIEANVFLTDATGPATFQSPGCPGTSFFVVSAFNVAAFVVLNMFWGVIFFDGLFKREVVKIVGVIAMHLAASFLSLINNKGESCAANLVPLYAGVAANALWAFMIVKPFLRS